jgi:hypothetical protein
VEPKLIDSSSTSKLNWELHVNYSDPGVGSGTGSPYSERCARRSCFETKTWLKGSWRGKEVLELEYTYNLKHVNSDSAYSIVTQFRVFRTLLQSNLKVIWWQSTTQYVPRNTTIIEFLDIIHRPVGWRLVVSFTPRPFYPGERDTGTHWIGGWVGPRAGPDDVEKITDPTGTRIPTSPSFSL